MKKNLGGDVMSEDSKKRKILHKLAKEAKYAKVTQATAPPPTPEPKKRSKKKK